MKVNVLRYNPNLSQLVMERENVARAHPGNCVPGSIVAATHDFTELIHTVNKTHFPGGTTTKNIYVLGSGTIIDEETHYSPPLHGVQREFVRSWDGIQLFKEVELADGNSKWVHALQSITFSLVIGCPGKSIAWWYSMDHLVP